MYSTAQRSTVLQHLFCKSKNTRTPFFYKNASTQVKKKYPKTCNRWVQSGIAELQQEMKLVLKQQRLLRERRLERRSTDILCSDRQLPPSQVPPLSSGWLRLGPAWLFLGRSRRAESKYAQFLCLDDLDQADLTETPGVKEDSSRSSKHTFFSYSS